MLDVSPLCAPKRTPPTLELVFHALVRNAKRPFGPSVLSAQTRPVRPATRARGVSAAIGAQLDNGLRLFADTFDR